MLGQYQHAQTKNKMSFTALELIWRDLFVVKLSEHLGSEFTSECNTQFASPCPRIGNHSPRLVDQQMVNRPPHWYSKHRAALLQNIPTFTQMSCEIVKKALIIFQSLLEEIQME
jgi:hypothetical protein